MRIGVGVEGPSDLAFWDKVLHKHFRGHRFDIRNMKNREKLIRETPILFETFQDLRYDAGFILVDRDDDPCVSKVLELFDASLQEKIHQNPLSTRFLFVCVSIQEVESWYLADEVAIQSVIKGCDYHAPTETATLNKGFLTSILKKHRGRAAGFNEIGFAKEIAPKFSPSRALEHSSSFRRFWSRLESKIFTDGEHAATGLI